MKVLVLHSELGVLQGGGETFTKNLFTAFAEREHRIAAAFVADRRGKYPIPLPSSIEPIPLPGWWGRKPGQASLSAIGRQLRSGSHLKKIWDRIQEAICWRTIRWHNRRFQRRIESEFSGRWGDYDAVYVHGDTALASTVARQRPTVLRLPGPVGNNLEPMLRTVHSVCANGDALVRIRSFIGDHVIDLPAGIDSKLFKPATSSVRPSLNWTEELQVVGYVGRLTLLKGVDLLAAAFRQVSKTVANMRLLIIGSGEEEGNIRSILAEECARGIVHIQPVMDQAQLPDWYRAMDLLVIPSRYENYSNALLEGMACGIPFVASEVGGNKTFAGAGWLFEPNSVSSLVARLQSIIKDGAGMKTRAAIGRRYVQESHSWESSAERLEWILRSRLGVKE